MRQQVVGAEPRGQQRLMGVAHRRVGPQQRLLLCEPTSQNFSTPSSLSRSRVPSGSGPLASTAEPAPGSRRVARGLALHARVAVDDHVADVLQQLGRAVAAGREVEQLRRLVDEPRRAVAGEERRVGDQADEERNVRLHAADAELLQAAFRAADGLAEVAAPGTSPSPAANRRTETRPRRRRPCRRRVGCPCRRPSDSA